LCESDLGTVDASLDTQLAALRSAVTRAVQRTAGPGADEADETAAADGGVELDAPSPSAAQDGHDSHGEYDAQAGPDLEFDDEAADDGDFGFDIGAGHRAGSVHVHDGHEQADAEEQLDAETYADAQADAGDGEQHDPFAMPWLGDPDYDRIAHPDHHAAGQS
jgi:hypothetical protein